MPRTPDEPTECDPVGVADSVLAVPGVVSMSSGPAGLVRTPVTPGHDAASVPGVRIAEDVVDVHVVARYGTVLTELGEQIDDALRTAVGDRRVRVCVEDILLPGDPEPGPSVVVPDDAAP